MVSGLGEAGTWAGSRPPTGEVWFNMDPFTGGEDGMAVTPGAG